MSVMPVLLACWVAAQLAAAPQAPSPYAGRWTTVPEASIIPGPADDAALELADEGGAVIVTDARGSKHSFRVTDDVTVTLRARRADPSLVLHRTQEVQLPHTRVTVTETITLTLQSDGTLVKSVVASDGTSTVSRRTVLRREVP
jgi:hypothetical protein